MGRNALCVSVKSGQKCCIVVNKGNQYGHVCLPSLSEIENIGYGVANRAIGTMET